MNVRVRFLSRAVLVALASGAMPLAAQSAVQPGASEANATVVAGPTLAVPMTVNRASLVAPAVPATASAVDDSATTELRGPSVARARVAARQASTSRPAPPVLQNRTTNRNAVALMIVGGAALVVGAVIGDDAGTLVMLGGAAVGLYGLYMFLT